MNQILELYKRLEPLVLGKVNIYIEVSEDPNWEYSVELSNDNGEAFGFLLNKSNWHNAERYTKSLLNAYDKGEE